MRSIGRLAFREVRDEVRAYYANVDTMKGAILLATMKVGILRADSGRFNRWREILQDAVGDIIEQAVGKRPVWPDPPVAAPEHERGREPWKGDA
jgi:hypothetical protein